MDAYHINLQELAGV